MDGWIYERIAPQYMSPLDVSPRRRFVRYCSLLIEFHIAYMCTFRLLNLNRSITFTTNTVISMTNT